MWIIACGAQQVLLPTFSTVFQSHAVTPEDTLPGFMWNVISKLPRLSVSHRAAKHITAAAVVRLFLIINLVLVGVKKWQLLQNPDELLTLISSFLVIRSFWPNKAICVCRNNTCSLGWVNTPVCLEPGVPCRWSCTAALLQLVAISPHFIRCSDRHSLLCTESS